MRRVAFPLLAVLLAGTAAWVARNWLVSQESVAAPAVEAVPPVVHKTVLVAATDLAAGAFIQPDALRWQDWPDVAIPESYLVEGERAPSDLAGTVLRRPVAAGEPITEPNLVKPGDRGFLAAVLDPGKRAVSVAVDEASSNAGLIFPGDRVDLILTQTIESSGEGARTRRISETVLENVRVIAMGRRLTGEGGGAAEDAKIGTATLEVTPAEAERVALVAELGRLSLSLRSLALSVASDGNDGGPRYTWDSDVSTALRPEQSGTTISVLRGDKTEIVNLRRGAGS